MHFSIKVSKLDSYGLQVFDKTNHAVEKAVFTFSKSKIFRRKQNDCYKSK